MGRFTGILGLLSMVGLAFAFSTDRRAIKLKTVLWGVGLQLTFAFLVLKFEVGRAIFAWLGAKVTQLLNFSYVGSEFIFGELGKKNSSFGAVFAFQILPTIIFIAALFALLYYLGVMQIVIRAAAWLMCPVRRDGPSFSLGSVSKRLGRARRAGLRGPEPSRHLGGRHRGDAACRRLHTG